MSGSEGAGFRQRSPATRLRLRTAPPRDARLRLPGKPHSGRRFQRDPQAWAVLHRGVLPAYIAWDAYERNQEQMAANRTRYSGTPRGGAALLGGLVACGVCGWRMFTTYTENGREARYVCHQMAITF